MVNAKMLIAKLGIITLVFKRCVNHAHKIVPIALLMKRLLVKVAMKDIF